MLRIHRLALATIVAIGATGAAVTAGIGCSSSTAGEAKGSENVGVGSSALYYSYVTGGANPITVVHDQGDEAVYFQPIPTRVMYNTQIIKQDPTHYKVVYHSESRESDIVGPRPGDSIISAYLNATPGDYSAFSFPAANTSWAVYGSAMNQNSALYYGIGAPNGWAQGASGGGNPMVVRGRGADNSYYMFFLGVWDHLHYQQGDWRDTLLEARTFDFVNWTVMTDFGTSVPFSADMTAVPIRDNLGKRIESAYPKDPMTTNGLIGSIAQDPVTSVYWYFYVDQVSATQCDLVARTSWDISYANSTAVWGPRSNVKTNIGCGSIIRVAKAKGMNRWAAMYNCGRNIGAGVADLCLEYTGINPADVGTAIGQLHFNDAPGGRSNYFLGLKGYSDLADWTWKAQADFMTDPQGNLASPQEYAQDWTQGGMLTWMDVPQSCGGQQCSPYGRTTYRAGWNIWNGP